MSLNIIQTTNFPDFTLQHFGRARITGYCVREGDIQLWIIGVLPPDILELK